MELEQLRQLVAVKRYGTISAAAEHIHITQPSLSRSIKRLEADLGQELFDRRRNSVEFNEAGLVALEHAERILADERLMREAFDEMAQRERTIKVGSVAPAASWRLTALVVERFPGTIIEPELMSGTQLEAALFSREIQLALTRRPLALPTLRVVPLMTEDLSVCVPAGHPLADRAHVSFADLDGETFMLYENIGFWMDVVRKELPHSQIVVQKDREVFLQVSRSTGLLYFTTDAPENAAASKIRVTLPITDASAHATYYVVAMTDAPARVGEIVDWVESVDGRD